ncbi:hypothetical protein ACFY5J_04725 [Peribacillus butanolivorans]|uniref:hypothetical protein n=1 Tax=Peribacillus butanolivorans TaxID=421767 RepID=UPI00368E6C06
MDSTGLNERDMVSGNKWFTPNNIYITIMYIVAFVVISNNALAIITGPVLAVTMLITILSKKFYSVILLIVLANDSLGTIALGKGSFYWLLIGLILLRILSKKTPLNITIRGLLYFAVLLLILFQLYFASETGIRTILITVIYAIAIFVTIEEIKNESEKLKDFFFHMSVTIFLICLSTLTFGGVVFYEESTRVGIRGLGIGDPNFSSLIINSGIAILLAQNYRNPLIRFGMILVMVAAMVQTASITGLICLLLILLIYFVVGLNLSKMSRNIVLFFLLTIILLQFYNGLPQDSKNESIDMYISRVEAKLDDFTNGNYNNLTTNRSSLTQQNLEYYTDQSFLKQAFGGNSLPPEGYNLSHNTYIDLLLRFGVFGTIAFGFVIIKRLWKHFRQYYKTKENGEVFLLKIVFLIFAGTLSIYSGNVFVLWYLILLVL